MEDAVISSSGSLSNFICHVVRAGIIDHNCQPLGVVLQEEGGEGAVQPHACVAGVSGQSAAAACSSAASSTSRACVAGGHSDYEADVMGGRALVTAVALLLQHLSQVFVMAPVPCPL